MMIPNKSHIKSRAMVTEKVHYVCSQKELIENKFDNIMQILKKIDDQTSDMDKRVKELEGISNRQKGALIAISAIYTFTVVVIGIYIDLKMK